jgi:hypothetical protein
MGAFADLTGREFGRLTVQFRAATSRWRKTRWLCVCRCGRESIVEAAHLLAGRIRSCGCLQIEMIGQLNRTHGRTKMPVYRSWQAMLTRCYNTANKNYDRYGGRGIAVCERWRFGDGAYSGFECFLADMGERPVGMSLDRYPNKDGNYGPDNCRWATQKAQCFNKSHPLRRRGTPVKLTETIAEAIRQARGSQREIARQFSVSQSTVSDIKRGSTWRR